MNYVTFKADTHEYFNSYGEPYISVTQLISRFKQPFDGEYWSLYKAVERFLLDNGLKRVWWDFKKVGVDKLPKSADRLLEAIKTHIPEYSLYIFQVQDLIKAEWVQKRDLSCLRGTAYHEFREDQAYRKGVQTLSGTEVTGITGGSYTFDLSELADGYHPELLLYNHQFQLAGQADRTWISSEQVDPYTVAPEDQPYVHCIDNKYYIRYADCDDFKTNGNIKISNKYQKMLGPLKHLDDCSLNHYTIQINTYLWMLSQFGFKPRSGRFTHIKAILDQFGQEQLDPFTGVFLAEEVPYQFDYNPADIENMLQHYKESQLVSV